MSERGNKRTLNGIVVSDKMEKTVLVEVERLVKHSMYNKYIRRKKKYKAHDATNECKVGDRVLIIESRPLSKEKNWKIKQIIEKAK